MAEQIGLLVTDNAVSAIDSSSIRFDDAMKEKLRGTGRIYVRCQDKCPFGIRHLIYFMLFIIAILIDIIVLLPIFTFLTILAYIDRYLFCECCGCNLFGCGFVKEKNTKSNVKTTFSPNHLSPSCCCCCCTATTRRYFGKLRLSLLPRRNNCCCSCFSKLIGIYQVIEFIFAASKSSKLDGGVSYVTNLWNNIGNDFATEDENNYVPFLFGIASLNYETLRKHMHDPNAQRSHNIFTMELTVTTRRYHPLGAIGLTTNTKEHKAARSLMYSWLSVFHDDIMKHAQNLKNVQSHLKTILPRNQLSDLAEIKRSVANAMFYILMGNQLNIVQQNAVERFISFGAGLNVIPSYIHFLIGGFYLERDLQSQIETLRQAFIDNMETKSIKLLYDKAIELEIDPDVALRNVLLTFFIGGMGGTGQLCCIVASRIKQDPDKYVPLYFKNKNNFIKECARLETTPSAITVHLQQDEQLEIAGITRNIPKGTPLSCLSTAAHRDPKVFGGENMDQSYANTFDPNRANLDKIMSWNALEEFFLNGTVRQNSSRYCPGHDIALFVIKAVIDNYAEDFRVIDDKLKEEIKEEEEAKEDEAMIDRFLSTLNTQTKFTLDGAKMFLSQWKVLTNDDIKIPTKKPSPLKTVNLFGLQVPENDESLKDDLKEKIKHAFGNFVTSSAFKITDDLYEFEGAMQGSQLREHVFGDLWPSLNTDWNKYQNGILTDDANSLFVFYGIGLWLTSKIEDKDDEKKPDPDAYWICDVRIMGQFETRNEKEMERLGAAAYFDEDRKLIGIYSCVDDEYFDAVKTHSANPEKWLHIKWLFRCSVGVKMTIDDHLMKCHLIESNTLDKCCREQLPSDHPLRRFFKPFIFRTTYINHLAYTFLVSEYGLVHRAFCYEYDTLGKMAKVFVENYTFRPMPKHFEDNGIAQEFSIENNKNADKVCPVYTDSMRLWNIHHSFIKKYLQIYYPKPTDLFEDKFIVNFIKQMHDLLGIKRDDALSNYDEFIAELCQILTTVTGLHEYLGNFVEYKIRPDIYCGVVRYNKNMADIQCYAQLISLGAFTGPKVPGLLNDFTRILLNDDHLNDTKQVFNEWQSDLRDLRDEINRLNKDIRIQPMNSFNPTFLECSVSI